MRADLVAIQPLFATGGLSVDPSVDRQVRKLSHDLITCSDSVTSRKAIFSGGVLEVYPSLIAPTSPSASFDTVGKTASLFFVNLHGRQIWSYDIGGMD